MILKILKRAVGAVLALLIVAVALAWILLQRSLPQLDGTLDAPGITGDVSIERDQQGVPTITAGNRADLAFATGFVHGQDRFFQMDLMRRQAAGELSEMFGGIAIGVDQRMRFHRFRSRAREVMQILDDRQAAAIRAYASGVNAGLGSLKSRPFEYFLLRETPREWLAEDSLLVAYAMFLDLNDARAVRDIQRGYAQRVMHPDVFRWMYPEGTRWDAALTGHVPPAAEMPGPDSLRLDRSRPDAGGVFAALPADENIRGSNNWAVAGSLSRNGRAIVANDMHLGLAVPNVFYRARLVQTGADSRDVTGVTLPGTPVIVTGSNGKVAWAFTNSYGDWTDAVVLQPGELSGTYKTPQGDEPFVEYEETIAVKGADDVIFRVRESRWGPVLEDTPWPDGELSVRWIGHDINAVNLLHIELETVQSVDEAMQVASRLGIPPQNFVCGDADGNIGWTIAGRIPVRTDFDPGIPTDWSAGDGWTGWLAANDYPKVVNPPSGRIWTANARVIDGEYLRVIGNGGYDLGARAAQIRDKLFEKELFEVGDMLAIQLDDRALFLAPWRDLLLSVLDDAADVPQLALYRSLIENWQPRASAESVGYRLVRGFRLQVRALVFEMLVLPVREAYPYPVSLRISNQFEQPLWTLVTAQPAHLLSPDYPDWNALMLRAVQMNLEQLGKDHDGGIENRSWGEFNRASIRHPLSPSLAFLAAWLDMPRDALDGDSNVPRVVRSDFGASERFGVSPGNEQDGYLHMPAGQSGHPLSDFYRAGHDDWVRGRATPFLPRENAHSLVLAAPGP